MTTFVEPTSIDGVCRALDEVGPGAKVIAGGTALVLMMRLGLVAPDTLVSLRAVPGLRSIRRQPGQLTIGALTTLGEVAADDEVRRATPSLAYACSRVGNVRVRNVATIAGNVAEADYASDPPTVLVAIDASCTLQGPAGQRSVMVRDLITGFFTTSLERGEIITAVTVPVVSGVRRESYLKYVSRSSEDRPCVGVAAVADFSGEELSRLVVVVGAVADVPQRLDAICNQAIGGPLDSDLRESIARSYAEAIDPMEDDRGSAWYRRQMIKVLVRRVLERVAQT